MNRQLKIIHKASMEVLEQTGIRIMQPDVLKIVHKSGIKVAGDRAYFTEDQVMHWVGKSPKKFTVYAKNPKFDMVIGGEKTEFAPGYGCCAIIEIDGTKRNADYQDYCSFLKIVHQSDYFNINGGLVVQPFDLDFFLKKALI